MLLPTEGAEEATGAGANDGDTIGTAVLGVGVLTGGGEAVGGVATGATDGTGEGRTGDGGEARGVATGGGVAAGGGAVVGGGDAATGGGVETGGVAVVVGGAAVVVGGEAVVVGAGVVGDVVGEAEGVCAMDDAKNPTIRNKTIVIAADRAIISPPVLLFLLLLRFLWIQAARRFKQPACKTDIAMHFGFSQLLPAAYVDEIGRAHV